jgi:hypothetical protein
MTHKRLSVSILALVLCTALSASAQTTATTTATTTASTTSSAESLLDSITMPTYIGAGVTYDQSASPYWIPFITAVAPFQKRDGWYASSSAYLRYAASVNATTGRTQYVINPSFEFGMHKTLVTRTKFQVMFGVITGPSFTSGASGTAVSLTGGFIVTPVYHITSTLSVAVPVKSSYSSALAGWEIKPHIALLWRP